MNNLVSIESSKKRQKPSSLYKVITQANIIDKRIHSCLIEGINLLYARNTENEDTELSCFVLNTVIGYVKNERAESICYNELNKKSVQGDHCRVWIALCISMAAHRYYAAPDMLSLEKNIDKLMIVVQCPRINFRELMKIPLENLAINCFHKDAPLFFDTISTNQTLHECIYLFVDKVQIDASDQRYVIDFIRLINRSINEMNIHNLSQLDECSYLYQEASILRKKCSDEKKKLLLHFLNSFYLAIFNTTQNDPFNNSKRYRLDIKREAIECIYSKDNNVIRDIVDSELHFNDIRLYNCAISALNIVFANKNEKQAPWLRRSIKASLSVICTLRAEDIYFTKFTTLTARGLKKYPKLWIALCLELVKANVYFGNDIEDLRDRLDDLFLILQAKTVVSHNIFKIPLKRLAVLFSDRLSYSTIDLYASNKSLLSCLRFCYTKHYYLYNKSRKSFVLFFEESMERLGVETIDGLSARTYQSQVQTLTETYKDINTRKNYIRLLNQIYKATYSMTGRDPLAGSDFISLNSLSASKFLQNFYTNTNCDKRCYICKDGSIEIHYNNSFLERLVTEFISELNWSKKMLKDSFHCISCFECSLGSLIGQIVSPESFCFESLKVQCDWYLTHIKNRTSVSIVLRFYRWLVLRYKDSSLFINDTINRRLLMSQHLRTFLVDNYQFAEYNPLSNYVEHPRYVFMVYGFDNYYSKYLPVDYVKVNLDQVKDKSYRKLLLDYITTDRKRVCRTYLHNVLCDAISVLEKRKKYGDTIDRWDGIAIKQKLNNKYKKNKRTGRDDSYGIISSFIHWAEMAQSIVVDPLFYDSFWQIQGHRSNKQCVSIPDSDYLKIFNEAQRRYNNKYASLEEKLMFIITILLDTDQFRLIEVIRMRISSIKKSFKDESFMVVDHFKTTQDTKKAVGISNKNIKLINEAISLTEHLRENAIDPTIVDYVFIHHSVQYGDIRCITDTDYSEYLQSLCADVGVSHYSAAQLRKREMSRAANHYLKTNNKAELEALTGHKTTKTTFDHYVDARVLAIEEQLHKVHVGEFRSIVFDNALIHTDDIPGHRVENGCGTCQIEKCSMLGLTPCMICKNFKTTIDYLPFWDESIKLIDQRIMSAPSQHDADDLYAIKQLMVQYVIRLVSLKNEKK